MYPPAPVTQTVFPTGVDSSTGIFSGVVESESFGLRRGRSKMMNAYKVSYGLYIKTEKEVYPFMIPHT